jgi:hypothetical protein
MDYLSNPSILFDEFIAYYNNLNCFLEDDTQFELMLNAVWPGGKSKRF